MTVYNGHLPVDFFAADRPLWILLSSFSIVRRTADGRMCAANILRRILTQVFATKDGGFIWGWEVAFVRNCGTAEWWSGREQVTA
jgi:hypothetical protein